MIKIKPAQIDDLERIQKLNHKIMWQNEEFDQDIDINFDLSDEGRSFFQKAIEDKNGCFYIAYDKDKMIGYGNGVIRDYCYKTVKIFEIENMGVIPSYKRKGVGEKIFRFLTMWAKKKGCKKVYLNCYYKNKTALAFYRSLGLRTVDVSLEKSL